MPTVELTNDNFETTISDNDIVVVKKSYFMPSLAYSVPDS